ncbi:MAG: hypothetical protein AAFV29_20720, partial [Myxococcota bacterium]
MDLMLGPILSSIASTVVGLTVQDSRTRTHIQNGIAGTIAAFSVPFDMGSSLARETVRIGSQQWAGTIKDKEAKAFIGTAGSVAGAVLGAAFGRALESVDALDTAVAETGGQASPLDAALEGASEVAAATALGAAAGAVAASQTGDWTDVATGMSSGALAGGSGWTMTGGQLLGQSAGAGTALGLSKRAKGTTRRQAVRLGLQFGGAMGGSSMSVLSAQFSHRSMDERLKRWTTFAGQTGGLVGGYLASRNAKGTQERFLLINATYSAVTASF